MIHFIYFLFFAVDILLYSIIVAAVLLRRWVYTIFSFSFRSISLKSTVCGLSISTRFYLVLMFIAIHAKIHDNGLYLLNQLILIFHYTFLILLFDFVNDAFREPLCI